MNRWTIGTSQFIAGVRSHSREFLRARVNVVLLVVLPLVLVEGFGYAMGSVPDLPFMQVLPANQGRMLGALFSTAFVTGLFGLSQIVSAKQADQRLVKTGFPLGTLLLTRLATVAALGGAVAIMSYAVLGRSVAISSPALAFASLLLAGVVYGLFGVLVGAVMPNELSGSLVLVFAIDIDGFLGVGLQNPPAFAEYFPLHYPNRLFESSVLDGTVAVADVTGAATYAVVLAVLVVLAFWRTTRAGGWA